MTADTEKECRRLMRQKELDWERDMTNINGYIYSVEMLCQEHLRYQVSRKELKDSSIGRRECSIRNQLEPYKIAHI